MRYFKSTDPTPPFHFDKSLRAPAFTPTPDPSMVGKAAVRPDDDEALDDESGSRDE